MKAALVIAAILIAPPALAQESPVDVYLRYTAGQKTMPLPEPRGGSHLHAMVNDAADRHGIPRTIAHAVITVESNYRCNARSRSGARGIAQVLPRTAASVGVTGNLYHCETGLEAGMRYLAQALRIGGHGCAGVSLYERGLAARPACTAYGRGVMRRAGQ